eukprot:s2195_g17.t1
MEILGSTNISNWTTTDSPKRGYPCAIWHEQKNLYTWAPLPIYIRGPDFRSLELALIQEWQQARFNFPLICQLFHPRKDLLKRPAAASNPQFGLATLCRRKLTPQLVKEVLNSPRFQNRLAMWRVIHDLGSNTKCCFEATPQSGLTMTCAVRRLASKAQEPFRALSLQALDATITWWQGKAARKAAAARIPWALSPSLEKTLTRFLRQWFLDVIAHHVPCHDPPFKVLFIKHNAVLDTLCNRKEADVPRAIEKTFMDPQVFSPQDTTPLEAERHYGSGPPIASFVDAPFKPMLNILAGMLYQLIPVGCPHHFAVGDVYKLLSILKTISEHMSLRLFNQDLAGFFTSIEKERFLGAWYMLLDFLQPKMSVDDDVFSVHPGCTQPGGLIKGHAFRRLNVTRKITIGDVPALLATALDMQTFALGTRCIQQRRGSPMGSPLSPALCLMLVSISEEIWHCNYQKNLTNYNLFIRRIRYVDNRLLLGDPDLVDLPPYETLLDEGFYGRPILLEAEPDQEFWAL